MDPRFEIQRNLVYNDQDELVILSPHSNIHMSSEMRCARCAIIWTTSRPILTGLPAYVLVEFEEVSSYDMFAITTS